MERVLDHNKHVQEAACSALATMAEEGAAAMGSQLKVRVPLTLPPRPQAAEVSRLGGQCDHLPVCRCPILLSSSLGQASKTT